MLDPVNIDPACEQCSAPLSLPVRGKCDRCNWCNICHAAVQHHGPHKHCPSCSSPPSDHEVQNYDPMWHDGDVYCTKCGTYVRGYDAG